MMMPVIQIIAGGPVIYYPDGITKTRYEDKEFYQVPAHAATDMANAGWARIMTIGRVDAPQPEAKSEEAAASASDEKQVEEQQPVKKKKG